MKIFVFILCFFLSNLVVAQIDLKLDTILALPKSEQLDELILLTSLASEKAASKSMGLAYYYLGIRLYSKGYIKKGIDAHKKAKSQFDIINYEADRRYANTKKISNYFQELGMLDSALFYSNLIPYKLFDNNTAWVYSETAVLKSDLYLQLGEMDAAMDAFNEFEKYSIISHLRPIDSISYFITKARNTSYAKKAESKIKFNEYIGIAQKINDRISDPWKQLDINQELFSHYFRNEDFSTALSYLLKNKRILQGFNAYETIDEQIRISANLSLVYEELGMYDKMSAETKHAIDLDLPSVYLQNDYARKVNHAISLMYQNNYFEALNFLDRAFLIWNATRDKINRSTPIPFTLMHLHFEEARIHNYFFKPELTKSAIKKYIEYAYIHLSDLQGERAYLEFKKHVYEQSSKLIEIAKSLNDIELLWELFELNKSTLLIKDDVIPDGHEAMLSKLRFARDSLEFLFYRDSSKLIEKLILDNSLEISKNLLSLREIKLKSSFKSKSLEQVTDFMGLESLLLNFHFTPDSLYLFIVRKGVAEIKTIGSTEDCKLAILEFRQSIQNQTNVNNQGLLRLLNLSSIKLNESLIIIPDQELNFLPFYYLLDNIQTISIYPSSSLIGNNTVNLKHQGQNYFINPSYEDGRGLSDLAFSKQEVTVIHKYIGGILLSGKKASKSAFLENASKSNVLHFSGHAINNEYAPNLSYLAFGSQIDKVDHVLFSRVIGSMEFNNKMIALSACKTGIGKIDAGEGVNSLTNSFLKAGAKSVVQTLWNVEDLSTSEIFIYFYQNLKKGHYKSEALQLAQQQYLASAPDFKKHPYYWAGIVVIGNNEPLDFANKWADNLLYLALGLVLLSIILYFLFKKK